MATYFGGKNTLYRSIINLIPRHERFVECFAGSAAVSRGLDRRGAQALLVELDPQQVRWLKDRRELAGHRVIAGDAIELLEQGADDWGTETVVFADPPYPIDDRRDPRPRYRCELDDAQHERLIAVLLRLRCRVLVCGHPWGMYPRAFRGWKRHEFSTGLRSGRAGVECVWTNFDDAYPLHDYRYFGDDKRTRQDLRRRVDRQLEIFGAMNRHHRAAILRELVREYGDIAAGSRAAAAAELLGQADAPTRPGHSPRGTAGAGAAGGAGAGAVGGAGADACVGRRRRRQAPVPSRSSDRG